MTPRKPDSIAETTRPDTPTLEGGDAAPEELTGRASDTDEDLVELFADPSDVHIDDGFRGGSEDEPAPEPEEDAGQPDY